MARGKLTFKQWSEKVQDAITTRANLPWVIGDLLNYGEANYGEKYAQAFDDCLVDYHTLQNWRWVARCFSASRRREALSWSHHEIVAKLPEKKQDKWLAQAERKRWSTRELRFEVRFATATDLEKSETLNIINADIVIDEQFAEAFREWKTETTERADLLRSIIRGAVEVVGFDKKKHTPLVKPKTKAA